MSGWCTLADFSISYISRQTWADVGWTSGIAALSTLRNVTCMGAFLTGVSGAVNRWREKGKWERFCIIDQKLENVWSQSPHNCLWSDSLESDVCLPQSDLHDFQTFHYSFCVDLCNHTGWEVNYYGDSQTVLTYAGLPVASKLISIVTFTTECSGLVVADSMEATDVRVLFALVDV